MIRMKKVTYYTFILCPGESVEGGLGVDLTYDNTDGLFIIYFRRFTNSLRFI